MNELKPCPFCGSEVRLTGYEAELTSDEKDGYWYVHCPDCGATVYGSKDKATAIDTLKKARKAIELTIKIRKRFIEEGAENDEKSNCSICERA